MKQNVALIGLGPHAKRIYLHYFEKHNVNFALLVDLKSKKEELKNYLNNRGFTNTKYFEIDDKYKDLEHLPKSLESNLLSVCKTLEITHIIITTEPKAHNMYIEFSLKHNIEVLTDKPITVGKNMTSLKSINNIRNQYYKLYKMAVKSSANCNVMCQRQYHRGYEYVKELLKEVVKKYQVPITYIDIYHCDGNWEMPHDLLKENHPYKYGYGKLFHSGYHFIDLLSDFIKINSLLPNNKKIVKGEAFSKCFTPNDEIGVFNIDDFKRVFKNQEIPDYYYKNNKPNFNKFGEKNFYSMIEFKNAYNQLITHVDLNLLHYGFSRRAWINSKDYYKENGRIRHERINIQVGTLLNIQIHSYQSKEIKDRKNQKIEEKVGGLEHFDIDIYRNVGIIGGKKFERIKLGSLYSEEEKKDILGYNELSRDDYLTNFFNGKCKKGKLIDQALGIEILYSCALGIHNYYNKINKVEEINVRNKYIYPISIDYLKSFSNVYLPYLEKDVIEHKKIIKDDLDYGINMNYIKDTKEFETYIFIGDSNSVASGLLHKKSKFKIIANIYFIYFNYLINNNSIDTIVKKLKKYKKVYNYEYKNNTLKCIDKNF